MARHRFQDARGRTLEVHADRPDGGTTKLFQVVTNETDGAGSRRQRLCDQPLRPSVVTALLQEVLDLGAAGDPVDRAHVLRKARARVAVQQELLDELEWFGHKDGTREFCCLWCDRLQSQGHRNDCRWLAARGGEK